MYSYIKELNNNTDKSYECDFSETTGEVSHPNDWIIYKKIEDGKPNYTICIDHMMAKAGACLYGLSRYDIISLTDDIVLETRNNKSECTITTDKYKYTFKKSEYVRDIQNTIGGIYKENSIELISVKNITKNKISSKEKYYLELDDNILNFYIDGVYVWSKIISLRYTSGIYFVLKDKVFTVLNNGCGILDVFNLDGSPYKKIETSMEYIEHSYIIYSDDKPTFLRLNGFIWNPIYVKQYIDIESLFADKLKQKTLWDGDDDDFNDSDIDNEKLVEDNE